MAQKIDEIRKEIAELSAQAKSELLKELISELDPSSDPDVESAWIIECERRLQEVRDGNVNTVSGDSVFDAARTNLNG